MPKLRILIAVAALALSAQNTSEASAYAKSPIKSLKNTNRELSSLIKKQSQETATEAIERLERRIKKAVNRFLDFRQLAKLALSKHWEERTPAERDQFVGILRELIERSYIKQLRSNVNYQVKYNSEQVDGDTARVLTAVQVKQDSGRIDQVSVEYKMRRVDGAWMVYDVITDDVSIVRNYRSQFNRIIKRKSYQALVQKMRKKLETI